MDTWLLEFRLDLGVKTKVLINQIEKLLKELDEDICLVHTSLNGRKFTAVFTEDKTINVLLLGSENTLLVDVHNSKIDDLQFKQRVQKLDEKIKQADFTLKPETPDYPSFPAIMRGREFCHYDHLNFTYLIERDFDRLVFDEVTPFQHIRVLHSVQYGNCVYVDNDINIAESDYEEYTRGMTGFGLADYAGKTVLVLGGGDGAVLRYLKTKNPAMITLVEIDQRITDVTKLYLPKLCGDVFDSLSGDNHEFITGDAVVYLEKYAKEGRKFDYVINEITTIPVNVKPIEIKWEFLYKLLSMSMDVLKDDGMYFAHGTSMGYPKALEMFEGKLKHLGFPVKFKRGICVVPSYLEMWVFYAIWKGAMERG